MDKNQRSAVGAHVNEGREQNFLFCVLVGKSLAKQKIMKFQILFRLKVELKYLM